MIVIVLDINCGLSHRAKAHMALIPQERFTVVDTEHPLFDISLPLPQVYKDGEYIGGFYELVKELPV